MSNRLAPEILAQARQCLIGAVVHHAIWSPVAKNVHHLGLIKHLPDPGMVYSCAQNAVKARAGLASRMIIWVILQLLCISSPIAV